MFDPPPNKCRFACLIVPREIALFWFVSSNWAPIKTRLFGGPGRIRLFLCCHFSLAPVRSCVLICCPVCLFVCVQASWLRMTYQVKSSPLSIVVPGQAHLCRSVGMYQLQPWYVPGDFRPYLNLCGPRYMNFHVPTVQNQLNLRAPVLCAVAVLFPGPHVLRYVSPFSCVLCGYTLVNLLVKPKYTLTMYTLEPKHISPFFVPVPRCDVCDVRSTSYRVVCISHKERHPSCER